MNTFLVVVISRDQTQWWHACPTLEHAENLKAVLKSDLPPIYGFAIVEVSENDNFDDAAQEVATMAFRQLAAPLN